MAILLHRTGLDQEYVGHREQQHKATGMGLLYFDNRKNIRVADKKKAKAKKLKFETYRENRF